MSREEIIALLHEVLTFSVDEYESVTEITFLIDGHAVEVITINK